MANKKSGKGDKGEDKPKKRETHHRGRSFDLPEEIKPGVKKETLNNPIDVGINPAKDIKKKPAEEQSDDSTTQDNKQNNAQSNAGRQSLPRQNGGWVIGFAMILSLAAVGVAGGVSYTLYHINQDMQQLKQSVDQGQIKVGSILTKAETALSKVEDLQTQFQANQQKFQVLKQDIESAQSKLVALSGNKEWVLSSVESLVQNAHEQILINRDIKTALNQLSVADDKLKELAHPKLMMVREALSQDMLNLKSVEPVDKEGIWLKLGAISQQIQTLSFKALIEEPEENSESDTTGMDAHLNKWRQALAESWSQVKDLVRVSRYDQNQISPILTEQEEKQLYYMMQYLLEQAKWAVLKYDNEVYQKSLNQLSQKLMYFFEDNAAQKNILGEIEQLNTVNIAPSLPSISGSMDAIKRVMTDPNGIEGEDA